MIAMQTAHTIIYRLDFRISIHTTDQKSGS